MAFDTMRSEVAAGVVCREHVRVLGEAARVGPHEPAPAVTGPQINMLRDGETVRAIEVICTCGERIVLNCVY